MPHSDASHMPPDVLASFDQSNAQLDHLVQRAAAHECGVQCCPGPDVLGEFLTYHPVDLLALLVLAIGRLSGKEDHSGQRQPPA